MSARLPSVVGLLLLAAASALLAVAPAAAGIPIPFDPLTACRRFEPAGLSKAAPIYPQEAQYSDADGWAEFLVTIGADGRVREAKATDGYGGESFREAARTAIMQWRYRPQPHDQFGVRLVTSFMLEPANWSSPRVIGILEQVLAFPNDKPADRIAALERALPSPMSTTDRARLSIALAEAEKQRGDMRRALYHIRHVNIDIYAQLDRKMLAHTMRLTSELEAADGNLRGAVCFNSNAHVLNVPPEPGDDSDSIAAAALAKLGDPAPLTVSGITFAAPESELPPVWVHKLTRTNFTLAPRSGTIDNVRLVCPGEMKEAAWTRGATWSVPDPSGFCAAYVFAPPGTQIDLTETF